MKIIPIIKNINSDIKSTSVRISQAGVTGYNIGIRKSQIYKDNDLQKILSVKKSIARNMKKQISIDDLPTIAGAIGLFAPLPFVAPILFCLGKGAKSIINYYKSKVH